MFSSKFDFTVHYEWKLFRGEVTKRKSGMKIEKYISADNIFLIFVRKMKLLKNIRSHSYRILPTAYTLLLFFSACLSSEESRVRKEIQKQYNADEVRIHDVQEEVNGANITVLEMIILNSPILKDSKTDLEDGLSIAKKFYKVLDDKGEYKGIRIIISNSSGSKEVLGLSKNYYYDKTLLMY